MDITICKGNNCPIKDKCHRHTAKAEPQYQSYFVNPPFKINEETNTFHCDMFWGEQQESIMFQLESILKGKEK